MQLSVGTVDRYLDGLADAIRPVEIHYRWRPQLPDPKDELVLEAAINGRATAVITHNVRDFPNLGASFGIEVLRPGAALMRIRGCSTGTYPLKLPASLKREAERLAKADGVSLNQWVTVAVAQKVTAVESAEAFFRRRAGDARAEDMKAILASVPDVPPMPGDEIAP